MKKSTVTIKGLTRIQANLLGMIAEDGVIGELINEKMNSINLPHEEERIEKEIPNVLFDEDGITADHEIDFN